ncbi:MAG: sulfotransferase [Kiloniellales bacterium]|nr:sulfotransferase [Kiloniellales bacterium]
MAAARQALKQGIALQKAGRLLGAARVYARLVKEDDRNADAWHLLGTVEIGRGNFDAAERLIGKALALQPDNAVFHHNLAYVLGAQSRTGEAEAGYRRAVALDPDYAEAHFNLAQSIRVTPGDPLIASLQRLLTKPRLSQSARCFLGFAAGKVYDDLGDCDRAFGHYLEGNRAKGARPNPAYGGAYLERILAVCDRALLATRPRGGGGRATPVFIVGMPRSGTSLAEQVLASHPAVFGAGELPYLDRIAEALGGRCPGDAVYPECLPAVPRPVLEGFAESYRKESLAPAAGAAVVTDKAPLNFRHLGLIALLFPEARIVHCRRDALDTCLSCFFQNFARGQEYSFDLAALGRFYRDYRRMMAAWAEVLPLEIFDLDYEDLVGDLEGVGRRLLAFCGLDWHPDCARFFETRRPVLTASRMQVRRPLYASSIGKWRRYAHHLGPLIEALGPYAKGQ